MGKSAKFYKRPTKKEKMGLSSRSTSLTRKVIIDNKFNEDRKLNITLKHERVQATTMKKPSKEKDQKPYSLITNDEDSKDYQDFSNNEEDDDEMMIEESSKNRKSSSNNNSKRKDLRHKSSKALKNSRSIENDSYNKDYVDLFDKPDPRKRNNLK